jgi:hypothetical protein
MNLSQITKLSLLCVALTGALQPADAATRAAQPDAGSPAVDTPGAVHDGAAPFAGRTMTADWAPGPVTTIRAAHGSYASAPLGLSSGTVAHERSVADAGDSIGKMRLGAGNWLLLTGFVGLLGASRRRKAR